MTSAVESLVRLQEQAPPPVRRRGRAWYPEAFRLCESMAQEFGRPVAQVAAVLAITSMDAQLSTNIRWTREILEGKREAGRYPSLQAHKVGAALSTRYPGRFVTGPKCSAFYRAIMGDTSSLVIDRWAAAALGVSSRPRITVPLRKLLETSYLEAAQECGETVRAFQAIIWITVRESTPKSNGIVPRLTDITI